MKFVFGLLLLCCCVGHAQIVIIPDANFKNALLNHDPIIDTNGDDEIQISEAEALTTTLDVSNSNISSLQGIEAFINIQVLNCNSNSLTTLDVSSNVNLETLHCKSNSLTTLNTSSNTNLLELSCDSNNISTLNLASNPNLTLLNSSSNSLSNLNVSFNTNLTYLYCADNSLATLDVSNNLLLNTLSCSFNSLTNLDLSNNTDLENLDCNSNSLTSLNLDNNTVLEFLNCHTNSLSSLDVSNNTGLRNLNYSSNSVSSIDLSNNSSLQVLDCASNSINTLDISNNTNIQTLDCSSNSMTNLNLSSNTSLLNLDCSSNSLTTLDLSNNISLLNLACESNQLTDLDVSNNLTLATIFCSNNQLTNLDVSNNNSLGVLEIQNNLVADISFGNITSLTTIFCNDNLFTSLDVSNFFALQNFNVSNNSNLSYLNIKNGNNENIDVSNGDEFTNLPNLNTVCLDHINSNFAGEITSQVGQRFTTTTYCTLTPAQSNVITGTLTYDMENNGCDDLDLLISNVMVTTSNGVDSFATFSQDDGSYEIYVNQEGDFETTITSSLPNYFEYEPTVNTSNFTGYDNIDIANFCFIKNQIVNDVTISMYPINEARPGLPASYSIVYKNMGTEIMDGNIDLVFDDTKLTFTEASETISSSTNNTLTFNYFNLTPLEVRTITVDFDVFTPPTVMMDDVLNFNVMIDPVEQDYTIEDNIYNYSQTVIDSYDPNDIHILEGPRIRITQVDDELHYRIRFQNTGNAEAINIVVKNELDINLDWNTFQLDHTSHDTRVAITNGDIVEFIFENINLQDMTTNEEASNGYIFYKIKPKGDILVGDIIHNQANIFFDFNEAIDTNIATTQIVDESLSNTDYELSGIQVYPNPIQDELIIHSRGEISKVKVYTILGKEVYNQQHVNHTNVLIDFSNFNEKIYIVKVFGNKKVKNFKVVKK